MTTPPILDKADRGLGWLTGLLAILGGVALGGLVAVTIVAVVARYFVSAPIFGIEDVSSLVLSVVVAAAIAHGARHNAHISVNLLGAIAGRWVTRVSDIVVRGLGAGIVGITSYALFTKGSCGFACGAFTPNLGLPHLPFYYLLGLVMAVYAAILVVQLVVGIAHFSGTDPNEMSD